MRFLFFLFSIPISFTSYSQFEWGIETAGDGNNICIDNSGNIIRVGTLTGTHDFDPGPGTLTLSDPSGNSDFYVQSLNTNGDLNWAFQIGGALIDWAEGLALDSDDNIYVTGSYQETVDFDPGPGSAILSGYIGSKTYVLKLNSNGEFIWVRGICPGVGRCITVDDNNDIIYAGVFHGTQDFDPGSGVSNLTVNSGQQGVFVSKLDSAGNFIWAGGLDGTCGWDESTSLITDSDNNIYFGGMYCDSIDIDPSPSISYLTDSENFLLKLKPDMEFVWGVSTQMPVVNPVYSLNNTLLYTGSFQDTIDADPGNDSLFITSSFGSKDPIIYEIDTSANLLWMSQLNCTDFCGGSGLTLDNSGNIYASGYFTDTIDIDPGPGTDEYYSSFPMQKHFLVKFDNSGNYAWGDVIGNGINGITNNVISKGGSTYFTGYFSQSISYSTPTGNNSLDPNEGNRFIFKLSNTLNIAENSLNSKPTLIKIYDLLGRRTDEKPNTILIHIYSDGTAKKVFRIE